MTFYQSGDIHYYSFEHLTREGAVNAIFTRKGGVSPAPWESLNLNWYNGDDPDRVLENHRRAFHAVGRTLDGISDAHQVHGADVFVYEQPHGPSSSPEKPKADALITDQPHITLLMRFADCVPVLLFDPRHRVAGVVHSGWRGTVQRVSAEAVMKMKTRFGSKPEEILAGIGPSICASHYEIGEEVAQQVVKVFGKDTTSLVRENGTVRFDLWAANRKILEETGVKQIVVAEICTSGDIERWFSYRAENQKTGGFAAIIGLG